jgi:hypothetical protein
MPGGHDQRLAWEDWRLQLLLVVMVAVLVIGLLLTTPVPSAWQP